MAMPVVKARRPLGAYLSLDSHAISEPHPTYDELTGKLLTVTNVVQEDGTWTVYFKTDSYSVHLWTKAYSLKHLDDINDPVVFDLALLRDLQAARQIFLGKSYWIKTSALASLQDNDDDLGAAFIKFRKFSQVTISDVLVSTNAFAPVRIVVKNDQGQEGFFDISVSPTNRPQNFDEDMLNQISLNYYLSGADPRIGRNWPDSIWKLIENDEVEIGMTMEQARFSWGDAPKKRVYATENGHMHEEWEYPRHGHVLFDGGRVISIEN